MWLDCLHNMFYALINFIQTQWMTRMRCSNTLQLLQVTVFKSFSLKKKTKKTLDSFQSNAFGISFYFDNWPNYCVQIWCSGLPGSFYGLALHDCIMIDFCPALTSNHISYDHALEINKNCCKMCVEGPAHMSRYKSTGISILSMSIRLSGYVSCFSGYMTS